MTVHNYTILYKENGEKKEEIIMSKIYTVTRYLEILRDSNRDISELRVGVWTGVRSLKFTDITDKINKFLAKPW